VCEGAFDARPCYEKQVRLSDEWKAELRARRARVISKLEGGAMVLFGATIVHRNSDVEYDFRQTSDFLYLTGFTEPDAALVLRAEAPHFILFVPPRDREREIWNGRRAGVEGALADFDADVAHSFEELAEHLPNYLENVPSVWSEFRPPDLIDRRLTKALFAVQGRRRKRVNAPTAVRDSSEILTPLRLVKSEFEIDKMRKAAEATYLGHLRALRAARRGLTEFDLMRELELGFREGGCRSTAYSSIVGAGDNATILHYRENDAPLPDGGLVLIDAGAEFEGYACDVTRTFPVDPEFSAPERAIYELVLRAQEAAFALCWPGKTLEEVHEAAMQVIEKGLLELGIVPRLRGDGEKRLAERYFMHRTSHYLGLDVHDVSPPFVKGAVAPLVEGAVITVEPGIYIARDDEEVPPEYRGIGVRIEDDVWIRSEGPEVLTRAIPKTVEDLARARRV